MLFLGLLKMKIRGGIIYYLMKMLEGKFSDVLLAYQIFCLIDMESFGKVTSKI